MAAPGPLTTVPRPLFLGDGTELPLAIATTGLYWNGVLVGSGVGGTGREVEMSASLTHIQWRYVGDPAWINLVSKAALTGPQGVQGIPGIAGVDGGQGIQGIPGTAGADGADGADGIQGIQGIPGTAGADGADGADGAQGLQGIPGTDGMDGAQGLQGIPGTAGTDGADGAQGLQGIPGTDGADGADGAQGVPGVGGSLTHFTESVNSSASNATVPVVRLLATNAATNVDASFSPKGTGAVLAHIPDNTTAGGNKRGTRSVDWQMDRAAIDQVASGAQSVVCGGRNNRASGTDSSVGGGNTNIAGSIAATVAGGTSNQANGQYQFVGGGASNTLQGSYTYGTIVGGSGNQVDSNYGFLGGGQNNDVTGSHSSVIGGATNIASGNWAVVLGGDSCIASGNYSVASGNFSSTRGISGAVSHAAWTLGVVKGDTQYATYNLCRPTTDATITELTANGGSGSASNRIIMPNNSAYCFSGIVIARSSTGDVRSWRVEGTIKRGANAAATAIVGTVLSVSDNDAGAAAWALTVEADTTNGSLRLQGTGAAATTIRWNAKIETVEIVF